jgi:hypothetical protein
MKQKTTKSTGSMFEQGDRVEVLANKDDIYNDFIGTVCGFREEGIVQVRDQEDNVWDCGENQLKKA